MMRIQVKAKFDEVEYQRRLMAKRRAAARAITIPPCTSPAKRRYYLKTLWRFANYFFRHRFYLEPSPEHRKIANTLDRVVCTGGNYCLAMPRGSGKASWMEIAIIYAVCKGVRKFIVPIAGTGDLARAILTSVKTEFETNERLLELFPDICHPIRMLDGVPQRGRSMTVDGKSIDLQWRTGVIKFGDVSGSPGAGVVIRSLGIEGNIRGMKHTRRDGTQVRPDLVLIDDPQTRESAGSPLQVEQREKIINGDILGLAGPGRKIAAMIACTVIRKDDVADRLLDRKRNPVWQGERIAMVSRWSDRHKDLWLTEYAEIRRNAQREGDGHANAATAYYLAHRADMDAGMEVYWHARFNEDEASAIQHAYDLLIDYGEEVFQAEFQNDPIQRQSILYEISAEIVASKLNGLPERAVPDNASFLVSFVDLGQAKFHWATCAFRNDMTGAVVGYGAYPGGGAEVWNAQDPKGETEEQAFYRVLVELCGQLCGDNIWRRGPDFIRPDIIMVDCGYLQDMVFQFCRHTRCGAQVVPSRGRAARYFKPGRIIGKPGDHWFVTDWPGKGRVIIHDSDYHRMQLQQSFLLPAGAPGSMTLWGDVPRVHWRFAEQVTAERLAEYLRGDICDHYAWVQVPGRGNHWLDCLTGCRAAAMFKGAGIVNSLTQDQAGTAVHTVHEQARPKQRRWW